MTGLEGTATRSPGSTRRDPGTRRTGRGVERTFELRLSLLLLVLLPGVLPAQAADAIYRCNQGEVTVFSDQPCDEDARLYAPERPLSVVRSPDSLGTIIEANAQYLEEQKAQREARRQARAERQREEAQAARYVPPAVRTVPVYPAYSAFPGRPYSAPPPVSDRVEARRNASGNPPRRATSEGRVPLPASSGRQLGARRPPDDDG